MQQQSEEKGKIFVGGLSWDTTQASLLAYFSRFGEVKECVVVMNPATGKSRGFGFVTFADPACVETVQAAGPHILDGKQIDPNGCNRKKLGKGPRGAENSKKKLFVGGLPASIDEAQLREGFSKYGKVVDVAIVFDQQKQRPRGFGFLTFESEESVDKIVRERFVQISGKQVECKRAEPRDMQMMGETTGGGGPPGGQPAMMMVAGPDGTIALVPAPTGGHSMFLPPGAARQGVNPADLAAVYRGGMSSAHELGQQLAGMQQGMRFVAPGMQMQLPNSPYMMMGPGGATNPTLNGGGFLVQGPGGQTMLVPAGMAIPGMGVPGMGVSGMGVPGMGVNGMGVPGMGVPGMGVSGMGVSGMGVSGMGVPGMTNLSQHSLQLQSAGGATASASPAAAGGGVIVQGPGGQSYLMSSPAGGPWMMGGGSLPTSAALQGSALGGSVAAAGGGLMMAYAGLGGQSVSAAGLAGGMGLDYASAYGLGGAGAAYAGLAGAAGPYGLTLPSSLYGYAKPESNGAVAGMPSAELTADKAAAAAAAAAGATFINPYGLELVNGAADSQQQQQDGAAAARQAVGLTAAVSAAETQATLAAAAAASGSGGRLAMGPGGMGYYLVPGMQGQVPGSYAGLSLGGAYGSQMLAGAAGLQADQSQAAAAMLAQASQSLSYGRMASSHSALAQGYHPYRR